MSDDSRWLMTTGEPGPDRVVIVGEPNMGKTVYATEIAIAAATGTEVMGAPGMPWGHCPVMMFSDDRERTKQWVKMLWNGREPNGKMLWVEPFDKRTYPTRVGSIVPHLVIFDAALTPDEAEDISKWAATVKHKEVMIIVTLQAQREPVEKSMGTPIEFGFFRQWEPLYIAKDRVTHIFEVGGAVGTPTFRFMIDHVADKLRTTPIPLAANNHVEYAVCKALWKLKFATAADIQREIGMQDKQRPIVTRALETLETKQVTGYSVQPITGESTYKVWHLSSKCMGDRS